jgi:hypothetical protein
MGKPLGFGSATIQVTALEILHPHERYSSLSETTGWQDALHQKGNWVNQFKDAMRNRYGNDFDNLENVRDLRSLLAHSPLLPVHYPRPAPERDIDGKNYEWFMGNKRSGRNAGPRQELALADEDTQGLPYIDRFGEEL